MPASKILVVDDSRTIRAQLRQILTAAGYDVILAADGEEGIQLAVERKPQLMILDIQMPEIDGYSVCQELQRLGPPYDELPVLFLTSLESHALELLGSEMGAYLQKPVRRESLLQTIRGFFQQSAGDELALVATGQTDSSPQSWATH